MFVSFLVNYCENGVCTAYYLQNISENEDLLSYPKVVIKKETFTANLGSFPQDFQREFSEHDVYHQVHKVQELDLNTRITFSKLNSYLVVHKLLSLHEVNKPVPNLCESFRKDIRLHVPYSVAVRHSM